jgi:RNA polymerase sigma-70 factor (ECF subfamily)
MCRLPIRGATVLDELELVRAFRADQPEPTPDSVTAARTALRQAIRDERRVTVERRAQPGRHRRQRRRRLVLAGALAACGLAIAGALGFQTAATPPTALAAAMDRLAHVAASQDWTGIPGPGQYLYTESEGLTGSDTIANHQECSVQQVEHRQSWIATNGSGAIQDIRDTSRFTSAADQATCAALNITDPSSQDSSWSNRFPPGGLSFPTNDWHSLSTDPATLLRQVHQRDGGPDTPGEWFTNVGDFMRESDVPPVIRAALYQAAALIPGVRLLGSQTDQAGQTGLGVGFYRGGRLWSELIFNQGTGALLAEQYFDPSGKLVAWTAYLRQAIVDTLPDYPLSTASNG